MQMGWGRWDEDRTTLASGVSLQNEYDLWTQPDVEDCLPTGTYHFGHFDEDGSPSWRVMLNVKNATTDGVGR